MSEFYKKIKNHPSLNKDHETPENAWNSFSKYRANQGGNGKKGPGILPWVLGAVASILLCTNFIVLNKLYKTNEFLQADAVHDTVYIVEYRDNDQVKSASSLVMSEDEYKEEIQSAQAKIKTLNKEIAALKYSQWYDDQSDLTQRLNDKVNEINGAVPETINQETDDSNKDKANNKYAKSLDLDQNSKEGEGMVIGEVPSLKNKDDLSIPPSEVEMRTRVEIGYLPYNDGLQNVKSEKAFPPRSYAIQLWHASPKKQSVLEFLKPKAWSAGLGAGYYLPIDSRFDQAGGFLLDLLLKAKFNNRFSATFDVTGLLIAEEARGYDAEGYIPKINAPSPYQLHDINISQRIIQSSIGLSMNLRKSGRLMPYVGLAFGVGAKSFPQYKYNFQSNAGELYIKSESHNIDSWFTYQRFNAGLSYAISERLDLGLETGYQLYQREDLDGLYFKTRMLYHF